MPIYLTSMLVIVLLLLIGNVSKEKQVFATLGYDFIWLMVSAFVLRSVMIKVSYRPALSLKSLLALHSKGTGATDITRKLSIARSRTYKIIKDEIPGNTV